MNSILPHLSENVIGLAHLGKIQSNWTKNNSESANHILKVALNLKVTDKPKFIKIFIKSLKVKKWKDAVLYATLKTLSYMKHTITI